MFKLRALHCAAFILVLMMTIGLAQDAIPRQPQGPGGAIPPVIEDGLKATGDLRAVEEQINRKWNEVRNAAGEPRVPGPDGLLKVGGGYYRQYVNGRIYYRPGSPAFHVYGYI